jgi:CRP-like cAMP-binding protein
VSGGIIMMRLVKSFWQNIHGGLVRVPDSNLYGVDWVVNCVDREALEKIKPLYCIVRMSSDKRVKISTALSGSSTYLGRANPYPGDIDFMEIVLVKAPSLNEAADIFAKRVQQNITRLISLKHIKYSELKIGVNSINGKGLKWELEEVLSGRKDLVVHNERIKRSITLSEAAIQRQIIKLDLIAKINGNWKEVTKVFRFAFQPESSKQIKDIVLLTPENLSETIYQEVYFSREEAKLAAFISKVKEKGGFRNPAVVKKYRDLMDIEIAHYGALGMVTRMSYLKLLKRWFNKLRMERDYASIEKITEVFRSKVNAVNELKEMIRVLVFAIQRHLLTSEEITAQLERYEDFIVEHGVQLSAKERYSRRNQLQFIRNQVEKDEYKVVIKELLSLADHLEAWVEERSKMYLINEILYPYAERLGIHIHEATSYDHKDLFRGVTEGNKMIYLINRYLRHDSRVTKRKFKKGDTIICYGDEAKSCFIILSGSASVTDSSDDVVYHHIRDVGPLTFIGEIALMHKGGRRTAHVVASNEVEALEIPREVFRELMQDHSFNLFIDFLSTDRLMEDTARERQEIASYNFVLLFKMLKNGSIHLFEAVYRNINKIGKRLFDFLKSG